MSHPNQITDPRDALTYLFAGNATLTLVSQKTGTRFTYKIRAPEAGCNRRFVGLLSGPDNTEAYVYMGLLEHDETQDSFRFFPTTKSRVGRDAPSWKAFAWTLQKLCKHEMPEQLEVWHEGRCGRCGRKLTVPESIASGLGPVCAGRT